LLQRTVFYPTGVQKYRFRHQLWETYLVARYLTYCIKDGFGPGLQTRAFNIDIYATAGEMLSTDHITSSMLTDLVTSGSETKDTGTLLTNCVAVLGNSLAKINDAEVDTIMRDYDSWSVLQRHVIVNSLAHRGLRADERDGSAHRLRREICQIYKQSRIGHPKINVLTASLLWCYNSEYARVFPGYSSDMSESWQLFPDPGLDSKLRIQCVNKAMNAASELVNPVLVDDARLDTIRTSTQLGFIRFARAALRVPTFVIAAVHYLYMLAVASRQGSLRDADIRVLMAELLSQNSTFEAIVSSHPLPEIRQLYSESKQLFNA